MSVEIAGGPALRLNSPAELPLYTGPRADEPPNGDPKASGSSGFFLGEIEIEQPVREVDDRSETSSIGVCSSADDDDRERHHGDVEDEEEEEEVQSKQAQENQSSLSSLDSLEDSLPIKRGLSNFYSGKSKSFTSLLSAANASAKDLTKRENPFNKRRRILMAWSCRASCGSRVSAAESSLPPQALLFASDETVEECDEEDETEQEAPAAIREKGKRPPSIFAFTPLWRDADNTNESSSSSKMPLRSPRSFSLSDLIQHA